MPSTFLTVAEAIAHVHQAIQDQIAEVFPGFDVEREVSNFGRSRNINVTDPGTGASIYYVLKRGSYCRTWLLHDSELDQLKECMTEATERMTEAVH